MTLVSHIPEGFVIQKYDYDIICIGAIEFPVAFCCLTGEWIYKENVPYFANILLTNGFKIKRVEL